jgi:hypothetical protein
MSSCSGRILHVLFVLTGALIAGAPCPAETLLRAAASIPRLSIVTHESRVAKVQTLLRGVGRRTGACIVSAPDEAALWGWAQDRIVICRDDAARLLVVHGSSRESQDTAWFAAAALPTARCVASTVRLEGGNVLADGNTCFVGADAVEDNVDFVGRFGTEIESRRAIVSIAGASPLQRRGPMRFGFEPGDLRWRQATDRSLSRTGTRQPVFHLDMFLTLAGRGGDGRLRVLVGDPAAASTMIGLPLPGGFPQAAFDEVAVALGRRGFDVIRNPLPFVYFDDPDARMRDWFFASANNCWVEQVEQGPSRVWLPQYGAGAWPELCATDAANAEIWRGLGFEVVAVPDLLPLADQLGALNCVSKILERET